MATNKFAVIDVQNDDQEIDLKFQDFGEEQTNSGKNTNKDEQTIYFSEFPDSAVDDVEQRLLEDENESPQKPTYSFWSFEYYQQYFDVDSKQVGDRIIWSAFPKPGINYLQAYIRPNPDLYGPFWVCITLVLTTAISGNLSEYLQMPHSYHWKYDFHKVTLAASLICSYAWLVPIMIWGALLWRGSKASLTLLELVCIYGYSLSAFVPVSVLWTIPFPWLQWCLGIVATVLSGSVLIRTILPAVSHEAKKVAIATAVVILVLHAALALGFMLYFFRATPVKGSSGPMIPDLAPDHSLPFENKTSEFKIVPDKPPDVKKQERSNGSNDIPVSAKDANSPPIHAKEADMAIKAEGSSKIQSDEKEKKSLNDEPIQTNIKKEIKSTLINSTEINKKELTSDKVSNPLKTTYFKLLDGKPSPSNLSE